MRKDREYAMKLQRGEIKLADIPLGHRDRAHWLSRTMTPAQLADTPGGPAAITGPKPVVRQTRTV